MLVNKFYSSSVKFLFSALFLAGVFSRPAFALSGDGNQHFNFDPIANWTLGCGGCAGGVVYNFVNTDGAPVSNDTVDSSPTSQAWLFQQTGASCGTCSVTFTYADPSPTGVPPGGSYIEADAYTAGLPRQFYLIVTDTSGASVTALNNDIIVNCLSPPATIQGTTKANQWATLFIQVGGVLTNPVSTVSIILANAGNMTGGTDGVYLDNLQLNTSLPCIVPPTNTFTPTFTNSPTNTPTSSPTDTFTITPTNTPTPSATKTDTSTPTLSPTPTSPNTPTATGTTTPTPTPPNTATSTSTPPDTATATSTVTNTGTPPPTFTWTNTFTATDTGTPTNTPTHTFTPTITFTPTNTNTLGPTATFTPPCSVAAVYPDPMDFQHNPPYNNIADSTNSSLSLGTCPGPCLKFGCVPATATLKIYTVSLGGLVRTFLPGDPNFHPSLSNTSLGTITWDGDNGDGNPVSPGFYFYVISGPSGRSIGQFAISRSGS